MAAVVVPYKVKEIVLVSPEERIAVYECGCSRRTVAVAGAMPPVEPQCPNCVASPFSRNALPGSSLYPGVSGLRRLVEQFVDEPEDELELHFDTEPVVGWRAWKVIPWAKRHADNEIRLASLTGREIWHPRQRVAATCIPRDGHLHYGFSGALHEAPWPSCMCGIWATRDRVHTEKETFQNEGLIVLGEVNLWGRVLHYKRGWRAQYASIKRIYVGRDFAHGRVEDIEQLERLYKIPVVVEQMPDPNRLSEPQHDLISQYSFGFGFSPILQEPRLISGLISGAGGGGGGFGPTEIQKQLLEMTLVSAETLERFGHPQPEPGNHRAEAQRRLKELRDKEARGRGRMA